MIPSQAFFALSSFRALVVTDSKFALWVRQARIENANYVCQVFLIKRACWFVRSCPHGSVNLWFGIATRLLGVPDGHI